MAAAAQNKRLVAIERLLARFNASARFVVINGHGNIDFDASQAVNRRFKPIEVN